MTYDNPFSLSVIHVVFCKCDSHAQLLFPGYFPLFPPSSSFVMLHTKYLINHLQRNYKKDAQKQIPQLRGNGMQLVG